MEIFKDLTVKNIVSTDSISENLTDSDLESTDNKMFSCPTQFCVLKWLTVSTKYFSYFYQKCVWCSQIILLIQPNQINLANSTKIFCNINEQCVKL